AWPWCRGGTGPVTACRRATPDAGADQPEPAPAHGRPAARAGTGNRERRLVPAWRCAFFDSQRVSTAFSADRRVRCLRRTLLYTGRALALLGFGPCAAAGRRGRVARRRRDVARLGRGFTLYSSSGQARAQIAPRSRPLGSTPNWRPV